MCKKLVLALCLIALVSCGAKNNPRLTGKKVKNKELISKEAYREKQRKAEEARRLAEQDRKAREESNQATETLIATSNISVSKDMIQDYVIQYKEIAKGNMREHGIPASITLAQGVLESGSGQGTLSRNANNHFGIKCHKEWEGPSVRHTDDAPDECFRKYDAPEESYRDHSLFLVTRGRYSDLFKLDKDDYEGWAHGLRKAGYATDPKYAYKLISLIERYNLDQYDREVLGTKARARKSSLENIETNLAVNTTNLSTHIVQKGDTLYSIAKKYNTTVALLQQKNNLKDNALAIGQKLKVQ